MRRLTGLIAGESAVLVLLHALDLPLPTTHLGRWLASGPPDVLAMGALRLIGLVLAYWMLVTTFAYALACATRLPAAMAAVEWATLPAVRRVTERAVATALAASIVAPGLAIVSPPITTTGPTGPVVVIAEDGTIMPPGVRADDSEGPSDSPRYMPEPDRKPESQEPQPPAGVAVPVPIVDQQPAEHVVVRGDNLWSISLRHLERVTKRNDLTDREVAPYWADVVSSNRDRIRSGDPDHIYPGEIILLPDVEQ